MKSGEIKPAIQEQAAEASAPVFCSRTSCSEKRLTKLSKWHVRE